jgi:hypothetical protein
MTTSRATAPETTPLTVGARVRVEKGCRALGIDKGTSATITEIRELGAEYSHSVRVVLTFRNGFQSGKARAMYARHVNRLGDWVVRLTNGSDPTKAIELVRG